MLSKKKESPKRDFLSQSITYDKIVDLCSLSEILLNSDPHVGWVLVLSLIHILIAAFVSFFLYRPFSQYRVFFWAYVITLATFTYLKAKGYYAIGLYPILIAFGSVYLEALLQAGWLRYLRPVALILPLLFIFRIVNLVFPTLPPEEIQRHADRYEALGLLRWEDGKNHDLPQDFADMLGWKALAGKVDSASALVADKGRTFILTDNYGQAGAINFYSKNKTCLLYTSRCV